VVSIKQAARSTISEQFSTMIANFHVINEKNFHPDRNFHVIKSRDGGNYFIFILFYFEKQ